MSLGQVLDADCDEPPNIRTFLTVLLLLVTLVTPHTSASPVPDPYSVTVRLQPYPVNTGLAGTSSHAIADDSYAVIEISLTTSLTIEINNIILGISHNHCLTQPETQIPLNLATALRKTNVDSRVTTIAVVMPKTNFVDRKFNFCTSLDYVHQDGGPKVVSTGWRLPSEDKAQYSSVETNYIGGRNCFDKTLV